MVIPVGLEPDKYLHTLGRVDRSGGAPSLNCTEILIWFIGEAVKPLSRGGVFSGSSFDLI